MDTPEPTSTSTSFAGPLADLPRQVSRHPYGAVAAAVGIGYALGGGIFTPLTSRLLRLGVRIGIRAALLPILKAQLSELVGSVIGDQGGPDAEPATTVEGEEAS